MVLVNDPCALCLKCHGHCWQRESYGEPFGRKLLTHQSTIEIALQTDQSIMKSHMNDGLESSQKSYTFDLSLVLLQSSATIETKTNANLERNSVAKLNHASSLGTCRTLP